MTEQLPNYAVPSVYLIAHSTVHHPGLAEWAEDTQRPDFASQAFSHRHPEYICSLAAKTCYSSFNTTENKNISRVRPITDNFRNVIESGHGSVLEHVSFTFYISGVSRVCTHELVRHRVGTAFSQTSGRYVRPVTPRVVLGEAANIPGAAQTVDDIYAAYSKLESSIDWGSMDFTRRKQVTSALRRLLPNGDACDLVFTANARALRHIIAMRTSPHAEEEIRHVAYQLYLNAEPVFPSLFFDATLSSDDPPAVTFAHHC